MFIGTCKKFYVVSIKSFKARQRITSKSSVCVANVRGIIDVIDWCRQIIRFNKTHSMNSYAWTVLSMARKIDIVTCLLSMLMESVFASKSLILSHNLSQLARGMLEEKRSIMTNS